MTKEKMLEIQKDLIVFQSFIAKENDDDWENEDVEEIQNTINLINNYTK